MGSWSHQSRVGVGVGPAPTAWSPISTLRANLKRINPFRRSRSVGIIKWDKITQNHDNWEWVCPSLPSDSCVSSSEHETFLCVAQFSTYQVPTYLCAAVCRPLAKSENFGPKSTLEELTPYLGLKLLLQSMRSLIETLGGTHFPQIHSGWPF